MEGEAGASPGVQTPRGLEGGKLSPLQGEKGRPSHDLWFVSQSPAGAVPAQPWALAGTCSQEAEMPQNGLGLIPGFKPGCPHLPEG